MTPTLTPSIKRILVPVDFSDLSEKALAAARLFSGLFDARVTPVHVHIPVTEMDEPYTLGMSSSSFIDLEELEGQLSDRLREVAGKHIPTANLDDAVIGFGNPAQTLIDLSTEYDLIVMGTHGRSGLTRFLLGSVAEKVLRLAHAPVVVVENEWEPHAIEKILVTTDFSDYSTTAFPLAIRISEQTGAHVNLLHVLSYEQLDKYERELAPLERLRKERLKVVAAEYFHSIRDRLSWDVEISELSAHEAILQHAEKEGYDLIVMATIGRTGLDYLMMGSTTTNIVRHVNCPVLSVNPRRVKLKPKPAPSEG